MEKPPCWGKSYDEHWRCKRCPYNLSCRDNQLLEQRKETEGK